MRGQRTMIFPGTPPGGDVEMRGTAGARIRSAEGAHPLLGGIRGIVRLDDPSRVGGLWDGDRRWRARFDRRVAA
jgi:hypothetical protein